MPGAGGNFMARLLQQAHEPQHQIPGTRYPDHVIQRGRLHRDWVQFEEQWEGDLYRNSHTREPAWLRITVSDLAEWQWARANALWKNSEPGGFHTASDPGLPAEHTISLMTLWQWQSLEPALERLQSQPVNPHQRSLWQQWSRTWCPHSDTERWQRLCDQRWRHLTPVF